MPSEELFGLRWVWVIAAFVALLLLGSHLHAQQDQGENSDSEAIASTEEPTTDGSEDQAETQTSEGTSEEDSAVASDSTETSDESDSEEDSPTLESVETPDFFDPTEEISEDYAVPFPVDI